MNIVRRKPIMYLLAGLMMMAGFSATGFAQRGMRGMAPDRISIRDSVQNRLNLSDEQVAKIKALREAHQQQSLDLRNQLNEKRAHLKTLTDQKEYQEKEVNRTIDEITNLEGKMMKLQAAHRQEMKQILPEEAQFMMRGQRPMGHRGAMMHQGMRLGRGPGMHQGVRQGRGMRQDFRQESQRFRKDQPSQRFRRLNQPPSEE